MPALYPVSIINSRLQIVLNAIDGGPSNGFLKIFGGGHTLLSTIQLSRPSGTISGGVLTFSGLPLVDPAASASGTAISADIEDSTGSVVVSGLTVGVVDTDIFLSNGLGTTFISAGQSVAITAATITGH